MVFVQVLWYYALWHYTKAWADMIRIVRNYLWFIANFFSIVLLARTLFSPWRRLSVSGGKGGEESVIGAFLINVLMRGIGFLARGFVIFLGVLSLIATVFLALICAVLWVLLPAIIFILFFGGVAKFTEALV